MICVRRVVGKISVALGAVALLQMSLPSSATAAQLQPEPLLGSRLPVNPDELKEDQVRLVLAKYAACVVKRQRSLAAQFVLDRTSLRFRRKYQSLADGNCLVDATGEYFTDVRMGVGMGLTEDLMRFALADALLQGEIATIDPAQLPKTIPLQIPLLSTADYEPKVGRQYSAEEMKALDGKRQKDQASLILYRFGDCAVRTDPQGARALLLTPTGSAAEGTALQSITSSLGACLEKGAQIKLNRTMLRGALAFSYYSLAHAPAAALAQH